ncbi:MAG: hypothetical protein IJU19_01030, partial [Bacteroidales bacterium]|nr:hypothetical protein [Bacteroidales bacterium]
MKSWICKLGILAAMMLWQVADAQVSGLGGYTFTTGVDASRWIALTSTKQLCTENVGDYGRTVVQDIGFAFPFGGKFYTRWSACGDGVLRLGSTVVNPSNSCIYNPNQLASGCAGRQGVLIVPYGRDGACGSGDKYIHAQTFCDSLLVVEFKVAKDYDGEGDALFQVQLYRSGRVQIVYGAGEDTTFQVGMCIDESDGWVVKGDHTAEHFTDGSDAQCTAWPGSGRYYNWAVGDCGFFYRENFNGYTTGVATGTTAPSGYPAHTLPTCWTFTGMAATTSAYPQAFLTTSSTYRTDGSGLIMSTKSTGGTMYAVLPWVADAPTAQKLLKFSYRYSNVANSGQLAYGIMTDPADGSTFHAIEVLDKVNTYWQTASCLFGNRAAFTAAMASAGLNPATDTVYIAFRLTAGGSSTVGYTSIEDVRLDTYLPPAASLPYTEDFDTYGSEVDYYSTAAATLPTRYPDHYMPADWFFPTTMDGRTPGYAANYLTDVATYSASGKALLFKTHSYAPRLYAVVDKDFGDLSQAKFRFKCRVGNATYDGLAYGYMTDISDTSTFVALGSSNSVSFTEISGSLSALPSNARLAFRFANGQLSSSTMHYASIDDLVICQDVVIDTTAVTANCSFKWWNEVRTATGSYTKTLATVGGCDSTIRLQLTITSPTLPYSETFDTYNTDVSNSVEPPAGYPSRTLPSCWTFSGLDARAANVAGYDFATGVDASRWKTLTSSTDLIAASGNNVRSELQSIGFTFPFDGADYTQYSVNEDFTLKLGGSRLPATNYYASNPFLSSFVGINAPKLIGIGLNGYKEDGYHYVHAQTFGDTMLVVEFALRANADEEEYNVLSYQVQLFKSGRVQFVYPSAAPIASPDATYQIGMSSSSRSAYVVNSNLTCTHIAFGSSSRWEAGTFQDEGRYYLWTPTTEATVMPQAYLTSSNAQSKQCLVMRAGSASDVVYAALPEFAGTDMNHLRLAFYYRQLQTSDAEGTLTIGTMTDASDPSTFVALRTLDRVASWQLLQDTLCFHRIDASARYLAFRYAGGTGESQMAWIDGVSVQLLPCRPVDGLAISDITTSGFRLSWNDYNESTVAYNITATTEQGKSYKFTTSVGATSYDLTGLPSGTAYMVSINPACGGDARIIYGNTACNGTINIPYYESFDYYRGNVASSSSVPTGYPSSHALPCWTFTGMSASSTTYPQAFITSSSSYRLGSRGLIFRTNNTGGEMYAALPLASAVPTASLRLRFAYKYVNITYAGRLSYGFMTDPTDPATFHSIGTLEKENTSWGYVTCVFADSTAFTSALASLGLDAATATVYVAFRLEQGSSSTAGITCLDNVRLDIVSCNVVLPYDESFDGYAPVSTGSTAPTGYPTGHMLPDCWKFLNLSASTSTYPQMFLTSSSSYRVEGNGFLFKGKKDGDSAIAVVAANFGVPAVQTAFSFQYKVSNASAKVEYGVMTNPDDASTFIPLGFTQTTQWVAVVDTLFKYQELPSGTLYLAFRFTNSSTNLYYGALEDVHITHLPECAVYGLKANAISTSAVQLTWKNPFATSDVYTVSMDGTVQGTTAPGATSFTITGLSSGVFHQFTVSAECGASASVEGGVFGYGCINPTDLTASYVTAYYGLYSNPYASVGVVDYGSASINSRHTIHTDVTERDERTNYQLATVPPGHTQSVRLGNWATGKGAEALVYTLTVDTLISDMLILKYAAVLQDPHHSASQQPRFTLEILDRDMTQIDPTCGSVDFIASPSLGWHTEGSSSKTVLWKDWTSIGIDLKAYHGQTVYIRLTTYDCNQSGHYGYAYFTLECMRRNVESNTCGEGVASTTFTAPDGFNYQWYTDTTAAPISTDRTITVNGTESRFYYCRLNFVDIPGCNYMTSTYAGARYPLALFDTLVAVSNCQFDVTFRNLSTITADGVNPIGSGEGVESAEWLFPGSSGETSSTLYNPTTHYDSPGAYNVTLIAKLAGGTCTDTLTKTIQLSAVTAPQVQGPAAHCPSTVPDTLIVKHAISTSWGSDTLIVNPQATTVYNVDATDSNGCVHNLSYTITISDLPAPTHLVINNTTSTSVRLTWTAGGSYQHVVYKDGVLLTTVAAGTNTYTVTGLTAGTRYRFGIAAKCPTSDSYSAALERFAWTLAASAPLPYVETFDTYGTDADKYSATYTPVPTSYPNHYLPTGWSFPNMAMVGNSTDYPWVFLTANSTYKYPSDSRYSLHLRAHKTYGPSAYACVAKPFDVGSGRLAF